MNRSLKALPLLMALFAVPAIIQQFKRSARETSPCARADAEIGVAVGLGAA